MRTYFRFDPRKATEVLLYISSSCRNKYNALKVLYFADKDHLARYGRLICGDQYVAMGWGPVPSGAYDIAKATRDTSRRYGEFARDTFAVSGNNITPLRDPNTDLLSKSDIDCLDRAIDTYGHMPFKQLRDLSHDQAYKKTVRNHLIPLEAIIETLPCAEALLEYVQAR